MKKIIMGLGNPGPRYVFTRHNVGFLAVDRFYELNKKYIDYKMISGRTFEGYETRDYVLIKPMTFMNLSGKALEELSSKLGKITFQDVIVIYDDVSLNFGKIRIRPNGSAGGHNGIKSIIGTLNSDQFARIRVGVDPKPEFFDLADYVLSEFTDEQLSKMNKILDPVCEAAEKLITVEVNNVMNLYNGKDLLQR